MRAPVGGFGSRAAAALLAVVSTALGACTLADVTVPAGENRVVVAATF